MTKQHKPGHDCGSTRPDRGLGPWGGAGFPAAHRLGAMTTSGPVRSESRPDARASLVIDTLDLGRSAGAMRQVSTVAPAPEGIGNAVIGIPAESPITLDLQLQAVTEGVLVTGVASVTIAGECARCLQPLGSTMNVDLQELFMYEHVRHDGDEEDEDQPRLNGELIDLEPALRDAVVLDLPFTPLCREDCLGLCDACGANLNEKPDHAHEAPIDDRWEALNGLLDSMQDEAQEQQQESNGARER